MEKRRSFWRVWLPRFFASSFVVGGLFGLLGIANGITGLNNLKLILIGLAVLPVVAVFSIILTAASLGLDAVACNALGFTTYHVQFGRLSLTRRVSGWRYEEYGPLAGRVFVLAASKDDESVPRRMQWAGVLANAPWHIAVSLFVGMWAYPGMFEPDSTLPWRLFITGIVLFAWLVLSPVYRFNRDPWESRCINALLEGWLSDALGVRPRDRDPGALSLLHTSFGSPYWEAAAGHSLIPAKLDSGDFVGLREQLDRVYAACESSFDDREESLRHAQALSCSLAVLGKFDDGRYDPEALISVDHEVEPQLAFGKAAALITRGEVEAAGEALDVYWRLSVDQDREASEILDFVSDTITAFHRSFQGRFKVPEVKPRP